MTSAMTTFLVAASGTSAVCYLLMTRMQNRRVRRASPNGDTPSSDYASGSDGWSLGSLFGHTSTGGSDSCGGDSGGNECGGGDSGGGGDGGGGGGGD